MNYGRRTASPSDLPILRPGLDAIPHVCQAGHTGPHHAEPPMGTERYGTVSCRSCGTMLAWTLPMPRTMPRPQPLRTDQRKLDKTIKLRQAFVESRSIPTVGVRVDVHAWRLAGCAGVCVYPLHDAHQHERYGRELAVDEIRLGNVQVGGIVTTGNLTIDLNALQAAVDGEPIRLTPTEYRILAHLATRLGRVVTQEAITAAVWADGGPHSLNAHRLRTNMSRLRDRLGTAERFLETRAGIGYRLVAEGEEQHDSETTV